MWMLRLLCKLFFLLGRFTIVPLTLVYYINLKARHNAEALDMKVHKVYKFSREK